MTAVPSTPKRPWWPSGGPWRRRAGAGPALLLAVLGLVAATLVTAAPRLGNGYADRSLRAEVTDLPYQVRDLTVASRVAPGAPAPPDVDATLEGIRAGLPAPLPTLIDQRWYAASVDPDSAVASGDVGPLGEGGTVRLGLQAHDGVPSAARLTAGAWPRSGPAGPTQVAVSTAVADALALRPGVRLGVGAPGRGTATLVVSGVFTPVRADAPVWAAMPQAVQPLLPVNDGDPFVAVAVTDRDGLTVAAARGGLTTTHTWRYRLDTDRLDTSSIDAVATAVAAARRVPGLPGASTQTSLDGVLTRFAGQLASVRGLLAMVQAGLLACLLGLILLAARVTVRARHAELTLLRARGASLPALAARTLAEAAPRQPAAVLAGWLLGHLATGRPAGGTTWTVLLLAVVTTVAVPVFAVAGQRPVAVVAGRPDLVRRRPSARRLTVEATVLAVAALGGWLLRRRGPGDDGAVDAYLAAVPALAAVAVALLVLRVLPAPLRLLDRVAARARGALLFLGVARAGRGAPVTTGPLAVLVVAVSTAVFGAVVTDTVGRARDTAADLTVPADAWLTGYAFTPATGGRLAALPGVHAVAAARVESNRSVLTDAGRQAEPVTTARILVVDAPAFARVVADSGVDVTVPAVLSAAVGGASVPAVVSPRVAAALAGGGAADVQNRLYPFRVAAVADTFPGVDLGTDRFVVLPWQALTEYAHTPIVPNRYLLAVDGHDPAALLRVADDGQRQWQAAVLGVDVTEPELPARLVTRHAYRQGLDRGGANDVLTLAFTVGAVGGGVLALLAVGFAVLADARSRARMLSRLRTLGFSEGQGRRLLVYELVPPVAVAALAGAAVGVALPWLLGPALGLSAFTPGVRVGWRLDPLVGGAVLALVAAGLAAGLAVEMLVNRRMRLGEVLRLGEENP